MQTAEIARILDGSISWSSPCIVTFMAPTWHEPRHALRLRLRGDQVWLDKAVGIVFYHLLIFIFQLPSLSYLES